MGPQRARLLGAWVSGARRLGKVQEIPTQGHSSVSCKQVSSENTTPERRESDSSMNCKEVPSESAIPE
eukprot:2702434-Pyramimonas_sp.AAC.1